MLNNIDAVLFDLDGTLIDSMWVWEQIDIDYFNNLNIPMPNNLKDNINKLTFYETAKYFKKTFNIQSSIEDICNDWNNAALYYYSNKITLKKGVLEFLEYLCRNNIKIALTTSNSRSLCMAALNHTKITKYFDSIVTADEVNRGKDFPDIYLLGAVRLNVDPSKCLVFEDILEAIKGAKLAKAKVCAVYDKYSEYNKEKLIREADYYIKDFTQIVIK